MEYLIEHIPILKDYRHPTNPLNSKKEVKFQYYLKYTQFVKDYKIKHGLNLPLCLQSFRIFLAYNNLWWLMDKSFLTDEEIEILKKLNIKVYR